MAAVLILVQLVIVLLYAHMDEDDAFYVGTAATAVETDSVYAVNPYTGIPYQKLPSRYILSPFPAFLAVISRLCAGLSPAIVAHTIFPVVFIFLAYLVLYQYSCRFFKEKVREQGIFMILCAGILWASGYSVYNFGAFTMGRNLAGKSGVGRSISTSFIFTLYGNIDAGECEISLEPFISDQWSLLPAFLYGNYAGSPYDGDISSSESDKIQRYPET